MLDLAAHRRDRPVASTVPDYRAMIRAVTQRDNARALIDGMTAASDLASPRPRPQRSRYWSTHD